MVLAGESDRMTHQGLTKTALLLAGHGSYVVHAHGARCHHDARRRDRLILRVTDVALKTALPDPGIVENFLKPAERHVETLSADLAEVRPGLAVTNGPHLKPR